MFHFHIVTMIEDMNYVFEREINLNTMKFNTIYPCLSRLSQFKLNLKFTTGTDLEIFRGTRTKKFIFTAIYIWLESALPSIF